MDKISYIIVLVLLILILVLVPVVGFFVCFIKLIKCKKIIKNLEEEHIKYVGIVKKVKTLLNVNEYDETIIYTVDINGREIDCVQHTGVYAHWRKISGWLDRRRSGFIKLNDGKVPEKLPNNKLIIDDYDYGVVGTKVNVYSNGGKYVTDIDEQHLMNKYAILCGLFSLAIVFSYFFVKWMYNDSSFLNLLLK